MSFTKIRNLTPSEAAALAFSNFAHDRFTATSLANFLSRLLSDSFTVSHIQVVDDLLRMGVSTGALQSAPGTKGGRGYAVTSAGVASVAEVELPMDKFRRISDSDQERQQEANANAGPVFDMLMRAVPKNDMHGRDFIEKLLLHWLSNGWLSHKQVAAMAVIATKHGEFIEQRHYVGKAMPEWTAPYIDRRNVQIAEDNAAESVRVKTQKDQRDAEERAKKVMQDNNRLVGAALKELDAAGGMTELDNLVAQVFPGVSVSHNAKAAAYIGWGSKALRVCAAALAFGKPPALVWEADARKGAVSQPDTESDEWKALIAHPGFRIPLPPPL